MSSHRVTAKPRLLIAPRLTLAVAAAIQPIEATATRTESSPQTRATQSEDGEPEKQPAQRYPRNGSRGQNAIRRHWISIFSSLMLFVGSAVAGGAECETGEPVAQSARISAPASTEMPKLAPADSVAMAQSSTRARSQLGIVLSGALMAGALVRRRDRIVAPGVD